MSRFIEDEVEKPKPGRKVARWIFFALMVLCAIQIYFGLMMMKQGFQLSGIRAVIGGSFFFLIFYAVQWLLRN